MKGYDYELLATKTLYANPPADGSSYDYTLAFCNASLLLKRNPVAKDIYFYRLWTTKIYLFYRV
uniref:DUF4377 domain-containing protein n=1 Tax=Prevotella sp. TaxID=59823 RepID=UPI004027CCCE